MPPFSAAIYDIIAITPCHDIAASQRHAIFDWHWYAISFLAFRHAFAIDLLSLLFIDIFISRFQLSIIGFHCHIAADDWLFHWHWYATLFRHITISDSSLLFQRCPHYCHWCFIISITAFRYTMITAIPPWLPLPASFHIDCHTLRFRHFIDYYFIERLTPFMPLLIIIAITLRYMPPYAIASWCRQRW